MKQLVLLLILASLTGCHSLHRSIKKSRKHRISHTETETVKHISANTWTADSKVPEAVSNTPNSTVPAENVADLNEVDGATPTLKPESMSRREVKGEERAPEASTNNEYGDATEEELAARKKFDRYFWYILATSVIGAPVAAVVGFITFNPVVFLAIAVPFLLGSMALTLLQIYKIAPTVPDKLVDKKYQRRYLYTDVVLVVVSILIGLGLLALVSRLLG